MKPRNANKLAKAQKHASRYFDAMSLGNERNARRAANNMARILLEMRDGKNHRHVGLNSSPPKQATGERARPATHVRSVVSTPMGSRR